MVAVRQVTMKGLTMNDHTGSQHPEAPNRDDDAWLESLLRQDAAAAPYVDDSGFSARVSAQLPKRRGRSRYRWIVPAMGLLGCVIGLVVFSGGEILSLNLADLIRFESLSVHKLLAVALPMWLLYWLGVGAALQER